MLLVYLLNLNKSPLGTRLFGHPRPPGFDDWCVCIWHMQPFGEVQTCTESPTDILRTSYGHPTDILQTRNRTLQTRNPDTTDKEPDILRTSYGHPTDILRTSYGHPTDKEPDMTGHEGTTPL